MVYETDSCIERLQRVLLVSLLALLQHAQSLHTSHISALQSRVSSVQSSISAVNIEEDKALFAEYNVRQFAEPQDWGWEPCVGFYDSVRYEGFRRARIFTYSNATIGRDYYRTCCEDLLAEQIAKL
jgi:hypothetical protein